MKNTYSVYVHVSPHGKKYVGITKQQPQKRWKCGLGYMNNPHFWQAIQKYGWDSFEHHVICSGLSQLEAGLEEKRLIQTYRSYLPEYGYNHSLGGDFGLKHSDVTRRLLSERMVQRFSVPENREVMRKARLGCTHTDESKRKISAAKLGKPHPLSPETRRKISEANSRYFNLRPDAEECRERLRELGRKNSRQVEWFSMEGERLGVFESTHAASRATGVQSGNIASCCLGKRKSAGGYRWKYTFGDER